MNFNCLNILDILYSLSEMNSEAVRLFCAAAVNTKMEQRNFENYYSQLLRREKFSSEESIQLRNYKSLLQKWIQSQNYWKCSMMIQQFWRWFIIWSKAKCQPKIPKGHKADKMRFSSFSTHAYLILPGHQYFYVWWLSLSLGCTVLLFIYASDQIINVEKFLSKLW